MVSGKEKNGIPFKAEIREQIEILEKLHRQGILSEEQLEEMTEPLRQKLSDLSMPD